MTLPPLIFGRKGDGVHVDLDRLYESRLLIQGVSGSGKSTVARSLLEQTHGKIPQLVVDFDGDFVTLREKFDYVLVGPSGDVPISIKTAKVIMRRLIELDSSAIFDISEMKFDDRRTWVRLACEELVHLPRKHWSTRLFVLDEAHIFCPERGSGDAESAAAVIDVITLGRKRGIVSVCLTQRLSKFHKDAAAELLNKIIGYTDDVDLARAGDQLGMLKEQRDELRNLEPHTFYVKGPAISRPPLLVRTLTPATKPPPRGQARPDAPPAPAAVRKILAQLVDLPKEAEEELRTIEDFKRRNVDLERRIRQAEKGVATKTVEKPMVDQAATDRAVARAVANARKEADTAIERLKRALEAAMKFIVNVSTANFDAAGVDKAELEKAIAAAVDRATKMIDERLSARAAAVRKLRADAEKLIEALGKVIAQPREVTVVVAVTKNEPYSVATGVPSRPHVSRSAVVGDNGNLKGAKLKIIRSLAELDAIGVAQARREQLGFYAGMSFAGGYGSNTLGAMRTEGLIDYPAGGFVALTDAGRAAAGDVDAPASLEDLHDRIRRHLSGLEVKIFDTVVALGEGGSVTRDELGEMVGASFAGGYGSNTLGALRTAGIVEYPTKGGVAPSSLLFPEGLA